MSQSRLIRIEFSFSILIANQLHIGMLSLATVYFTCMQGWGSIGHSVVHIHAMIPLPLPPYVTPSWIITSLVMLQSWHDLYIHANRPLLRGIVPQSGIVASPL